MSNKKIPQRQCVFCREMKSKKELIRIVKKNDGDIVFDNSGKVPGRGAYVCKNNECIMGSKKKKCFDRVFETKFDDNFFESLKKEIINE